MQELDWLRLFQLGMVFNWFSLTSHHFQALFRTMYACVTVKRRWTGEHLYYYYMLKLSFFPSTHLVVVSGTNNSNLGVWPIHHWLDYSVGWEQRAIHLCRRQRCGQRDAALPALPRWDALRHTTNVFGFLRWRVSGYVKLSRGLGHFTIVTNIMAFCRKYEYLFSTTLCPDWSCPGVVAFRD